jgi:hypothetical protein
MENDFMFFMEQLKKALMMINENYIDISMYQLPDSKYRERVYCYELYHQLRKILGDHYNYMLDGELSKNAHPIIEKEIGAKIPDFLIHYRNKMDHNLAIIEVKPIKSVNDSITNLNDDLDKIIDFIDIAEYQYGIMLIYSNGMDPLNDNIIKAFKDRTDEYHNKVFLIWHPGPNLESEIITY